MLNVLVYHPDEGARYAALLRVPTRRVAVHVAATPETAAPLIAATDVLYAWRFPAELYAKAGRLRWLHAMGAGVEWALVPELPPRVAVTRTPGVFGPWMAEYVLGWCARVTQRMETYRTAQRERRWLGDVIPTPLRSTTMVIVGMGDIGRAIARAARALGVRVIGVSRSGRRVPEAERMYPMRALVQPLRSADWVVVVLPLTAATDRLVGERALGAMRSTAWLLNLGRGATVDEGALLRALRERRIGGAVLDVFPTEPLPREHPFWTLDNVVVTPHIAGPSTPEEISPIFCDNLGRFLAGRPLRHLVNRRRGY